MTQERVILVGVETERNYSTFASSMNELKHGRKLIGKQ